MGQNGAKRTSTANKPGKTGGSSFPKLKEYIILSRLFAKGPKTVLELTCFSLTATYKMLGN
jgi:hypothetical protein